MMDSPDHDGPRLTFDGITRPRSRALVLVIARGADASLEALLDELPVSAGGADVDVLVASRERQNDVATKTADAGVSAGLKG